MFRVRVAWFGMRWHCRCFPKTSKVAGWHTSP